MPKARLRYAIAIDAGLHRDGSSDPVVHVRGSQGGRALPFLVRRGWSGPQGAYVEQFRIVGAADRVTHYRSEPRVIELTGEFFTDDVEDTVEGVRLQTGEYQLVFTLDDEVVLGVPVFVAPGPGAVGGPPVLVPSIVEEATKKSEVLWIGVEGNPGQAERPAWHVWHQGAVYLVFDGSEQRMPGLAEAESALVTVRSKDKGGTVVSWCAAVDLVPPGTPAWDDVVPLLVGKRLNSRDGEAAAERYARECKVARLVPTGDVPESPERVREDGRIAPPAPTTAGTVTRIPKTLHRPPRKGFAGRRFGSPASKDS